MGAAKGAPPFLFFRSDVGISHAHVTITTQTGGVAREDPRGRCIPNKQEPLRNITFPTKISKLTRTILMP